MIHSSERSTKEYREFLIKLGACPECMSIPEHHIEEPFATCGCCTSENYAKSPLMQAQLMRAALKEMANTIEMLRACCTDTGADDEAAHTLHLYNRYKDQAND